MSDLPVFRTGGVLSASAVNRVISAVDYLSGQYYSNNTGGSRLNANIDSQPEAWAGWAVLRGDTLKLEFVIQAWEPGTRADVTFDGVAVASFAMPNPGDGGMKTIPLSGFIASNGWREWMAYRVAVQIHNGRVEVHSVHLTNSTIPAAGTMPTFTSGATSAAADFNALSDGLGALEASYTMPSVGVIGGMRDFMPYVQVQHRLNGVRLVATLSAGNKETRLKVLYNSAAIADYVLPSHQMRRYDEIIALPGGLTVGNFYPLTTVLSSNGDDHWAEVRHLYEEQRTPPGLIAMPQFVHGDYADNVRLQNIANNVSTLSGLRRWINWVQRESLDQLSIPAAVEWQFHHIRRWRWLAWKQRGEEASSIHWTYDGITWNAYTLPTAPGYEKAFFDLDTCPVQPGMSFYVRGVYFAIQTPNNGLEQ